MNHILSLLKSNFNLKSLYFRYSIRLSISCFFVVFFYKILELNNGYWAAFSVIACVYPTHGRSLQRVEHRVIGTFIGMCLGILIAHLVGADLILTDIFIMLFIFLTFYLKPFSYMLYSVFTTVVTVLFVCLLTPGNWEIGVIRLEMTILGALIALAATFLILPTRITAELPKKLHKTLNSLQEYYLLICNNYHKNNDAISFQACAFSDLQNTLDTIEESYFEGKYTLHQNDFPKKEYEALKTIYQNLLMIEVHIPKEIKNKDLQLLITPLEEILTEITPLFNSYDNDRKEILWSELKELNQKIKELRMATLSDFSIQSVTFYEHMQLTLFIEQLLFLLKNIREVFILQKNEISKLNAI